MSQHGNLEVPYHFAVIEIAAYQLQTTAVMEYNDTLMELIIHIVGSSLFAATYTAFFLAIKRNLDKRSLIIIIVLSLVSQELNEPLAGALLPPDMNLNIPRFLLLLSATPIILTRLIRRRDRSFDRVIGCAYLVILTAATILLHTAFIPGMMYNQLRVLALGHVTALAVSPNYDDRARTYCEQLGISCQILERLPDKSLAPLDIYIPPLMPVTLSNGQRVQVGGKVIPEDTAHVAAILNYPDTTILIRDFMRPKQILLLIENGFNVWMLIVIAWLTLGAYLVSHLHHKVLFKNTKQEIQSSTQAMTEPVSIS